MRIHAENFVVFFIISLRLYKRSLKIIICKLTDYRKYVHLSDL